MRPLRIPDNLVPDGARKVRFGAPAGHDDDVAACHAIIATEQGGSFDGAPQVQILVGFDDDELERLADTRAIWLTLLTDQLPPFRFEVADGRGEPTRDAEVIDLKTIADRARDLLVAIASDERGADVTEELIRLRAAVEVYDTGHARAAT